MEAVKEGGARGERGWGEDGWVTSREKQPVVLHLNQSESACTVLL